MEAIYKYIAEKLLAPDAAAKQYDRISDAILSLEEMPTRIKVIESEPERSKGIRALIVDNYSVFFIVKTNIVNVFRVLYGASDINNRLADNT